jgi:maltose alpha-D-glucosyltransferase/alpha-amylase
MPGTVIRYGEETSMGDTLDLPERESIGIPMQWDGIPGGGFSRPDSSRFAAPLIAEGPTLTLHALRECEEIGQRSPSFVN